VLRPNGVLFLVVPDRAAHFDKDRPLTSIEHLGEDYESGSQLSRTAHYVEYAELVNKKTGRDAYNHAADLEKRPVQYPLPCLDGEKLPGDEPGLRSGD
jgi:hypothetical protein